MSAAILLLPLRRLAPDIAARLAVILATLAAIVARCLLQKPRYVALIVPLWNRLNRAARRFDRLMARVAAGRPARRRRPSSRGGPPSPRLPQGHAWLVRAIGHEAAACGSQLQFLLAEPGVADLIAATPAAGRILRPIARMLGLPAAAIPPAAPPPPAARPHPPPADDRGKTTRNDAMASTSCVQPTATRIRKRRHETESAPNPLDDRHPPSRDA